MAYVPLTPEEEELLKQQAAGAPIAVAGTEGALTPQSAGRSPNQTRMSPFTDVASYLDANKEQGIGLGQKVNERISQEGTAAKAGAEEVSGSFKSAVDAGTFRPNEEEVNAAAADPIKYSATPENVGRFNNAAKGIYTGPAALEELPGYTPAQSAAEKANRTSKLLDSTAGRQELVSGFQKNPTRGKSSFDAMIFGQNPDAIASAKETAVQFGDLENFLAGKAAEAGAYAGQAAADRDASKAMITEKFTGEGGAMPTLKNDVDTAVQSRRQALSDIISGLPSQIGDYSWTPDELKALGIDESAVAGLAPYASTLQGQHGVSIIPSSYFSQEVIPDYVTPENTVTPEQIAKYNALAALLGQESDFISEEQRAAAAQVPDKLGSLNIGALSGDLRNTLSSKDQQFLSKYRAGFNDDQYDLSRHRKEYYLAKHGIGDAYDPNLNPNAEQNRQNAMNQNRIYINRIVTGNFEDDKPNRAFDSLPANDKAIMNRIGADFYALDPSGNVDVSKGYGSL